MKPPRLFDRNLERQRRIQKPPNLPQAFSERLIEDTLDRLALIKRSFPRVLLCGHFASSIAPMLVMDGREIFTEGRDLRFDAESVPLADASLDLIHCIFGLETVNDLPGSLIQFRRALRPDGLFLACMFAGDTLHELRAAWLEAEAALRGGAYLRVAPFVDVRELGALLQRAGFALPVADLDRIMLRYPSPLALMQEIKALGLAAPMSDRPRIPVTAGLLAAVAAAYERKFQTADGRISATVEVAWLTGWAPHESQQQPLKPGSAKFRLAEALKVEERPLKRN